ncbi:hypothetical protein K435DRAFT_120429 [Dendrothele bispora CBS 962.96]|uniref:Uncharacterized protein n=1 Tax=Dendrothele bispora (strain CBS 962.96) TaxID=1314807 RepID=A0A4S8MQH7_DENBC|nr:hypothetical protein K435DRAFT_120429 [Dendrothele bispora CBS 962.96]
MGSHPQQPMYPQVPDGSSPDSSPGLPDLENNYFPSSYARKPGLKSRRSRSMLARHSNFEHDDPNLNAHGKGASRSKYDGSTSRSRHTSSAASAQALLIVTNEELKRRIATLENEQSRAVGMFAELVQERNSLRKTLDDANVKNKMYEVQYEAARRELRTANQMMQRLEDERAEADAEAAKQRKKVRELLAEQSVRAGWDEGYKEGFEEAYKHVQRRISQGDIREVMDDRNNPGLFSRIRRARAMSSDRTSRKSGTTMRSQSDSNDGGEDFPTAGAGPSRARSSSRPRVDSRSQSVSSPPVRPSSVRPPSAPPYLHRPPSQGRSKTPVARDMPNTEPFPAFVTNHSSPESIHPIMPNQVNDNGNIYRPPVARNVTDPGPTLDQRKINNPPNIYTSLGDSFEFRPSEVIATSTPIDEQPQVNRGNEESRGRQMGSRRDVMPRSRMTSRASTRISEYDLVSSPRQSGTSRTSAPRTELQTGHNPVAVDRSDGTYGTSRELVEEWRNVVTPNQDNSPPQGSPPGRSKTPSQAQHVITPFLSFANRLPSIPRSNSLRSPRVNGGPRQPREVPIPPTSQSSFQAAEPTFTPTDRTLTQSRPATSPPKLSKQDHHQVDPINRQTGQPVASTSRKSGSNSSTTTYDSPAGIARAKTPIDWLRQRFQRSYSHPGVPTDIGIQIEPPSQSPTNSEPATTVLNPILLSPEHANQPIPLPNDIIAEATRGVTSLGPSSTPVPFNPITITLPDNDLPLGFVPTTPVIPTGGTRLEPRSPPRSSTPGRSNGARSPELFSPVPNNPVLSDPFTMSPIPRPGTAPSTQSGEQARSPRFRTLSSAFGFGGGWASPDPTRLDRPISIFSESDEIS